MVSAAQTRVLIGLLVLLWQGEGGAQLQVSDNERYTPMIGRDAWAGMAYSFALVAGLLTLVGALVLLRLYRWRVGHWMMRAAAVTSASSPAVAAGATAPPRVATALELRELEPLRAPPPQGDPRRAASLVQATAGITFALVGTGLTFRLGGLAPSPLRFATLVWAHLLPLLLVLWLLWSGDARRRRLVLTVYVAGLALLCLAVGLSSTPPLPIGPLLLPPWSTPLLYWAMASYQSVYLLLFLNRKVRALGPVLLTIALACSTGGALLTVVASTPAGMTAVLALSRPLGGPPGLLGLQALTFLAGALLFAPLGLAGAWLLSRADERGWLNDQTLVFDMIWLLEAIVLCGLLVNSGGVAGWLGLLALVAGKGAAWAGGLWVRGRVMARPRRRLLLLRVFGDRRRSERLFDQLLARWAWLGPLRIIAAPDLAGRTIGPGEFLDFVMGRLRRQFVIEAGDLRPRLARMRLPPDIDGRYRVDDLLCGKDCWQPAVQALMADSDIVAMDLRGFTGQRLGCRYELGALLDKVAAERIVLLVDASTDRALLLATLRERAAELDAASPNAAGPVAIIQVLDAAPGDAVTVGELVRMADAT